MAWPQINELFPRTSLLSGGGLAGSSHEAEHRQNFDAQKRSLPPPPPRSHRCRDTVESEVSRHFCTRRVGECRNPILPLSDCVPVDRTLRQTVAGPTSAANSSFGLRWVRTLHETSTARRPVSLPELLEADSRREFERTLQVAAEVVRGNFIHEISNRFCRTLSPHLIITQPPSY